MLGAIAGDVIGSVHEHLATKSMDFELFPPGCRFTDDTVLTVAVAECLLTGSSYVDAFHEYFLAYPNAGYGYNFFHWASSGDRRPYNSWGNGAAMRVSAVGHAFDRLEDVLAHAARFDRARLSGEVFLAASLAFRARRRRTAFAPTM